MLTPITDFSLRSTRPNIVQTQENANENTTSSPIPATTPSTPPLGAEAQHQADAEDHRGGQDVAQHVAEDHADQGGRPPDRQRAEPVEDALLDVGVEADAGVHGDHHDAGHHDARQEELQVLAAAMPASAPPNRYVNISIMMIGNAVTSKSCSGTCLIFSIARQPNVTDADQRAGPGRSGTGREDGRQGLGGRDVDGGARVRWSVVGGGSSGCLQLVVARRRSGAAGWSVRARKTSSRLGWPREKSSTTMPARASSASARAACSLALEVGAVAADAGGQRDRVGVESAPARPSARGQHPLRLGRCAASRSRRWTVPAPTDDFSSPGVPSAITLPWSMTAIRPASWSASSRYCVVSSTVVPCATTARMISHTWLRLRGSRPVVGSSRNSRSGVLRMLAAMSMRRRMPPEYFFTCRSRRLGQPERGEQLLGPLPRGRLAMAEQPAEQHQVLRAGQVLVDRGVLAGQADPGPHRVGLA